jgi:hypothetical protein
MGKVEVKVSDYTVEDKSTTVGCTAVVYHDGAEVYRSLVMIPLEAIADRQAKYGLEKAEPTEIVAAIMREHTEMWFGVNMTNADWRGTKEHAAVRKVLRAGKETGGLRTDVAVAMVDKVKNILPQ